MSFSFTVQGPGGFTNVIVFVAAFPVMLWY
jgi:hypothetical protein